jgi:hypothetical protein
MKQFAIRLVSSLNLLISEEIKPAISKKMERPKSAQLRIIDQKHKAKPCMRNNKNA